MLMVLCFSGRDQFLQRSNFVTVNNVKMGEGQNVDHLKALNLVSHFQHPRLLDPILPDEPQVVPIGPTDVSYADCEL